MKLKKVKLVLVKIMILNFKEILILFLVMVIKLWIDLMQLKQILCHKKKNKIILIQH